VLISVRGNHNDSQIGLLNTVYYPQSLVLPAIIVAGHAMYDMGSIGADSAVKITAFLQIELYQNKAGVLKVDKKQAGQAVSNISASPPFIYD